MTAADQARIDRRARGACSGAIAALGLLLSGCGAWSLEPGGWQTLHVVSKPAGATLTVSGEQGTQQAGTAPANVPVEYQSERFHANHHCWWWPGVSVVVAGVSGALLGTVGLGVCQSRANGERNGFSEGGCTADPGLEWRGSVPNAGGIASIVGIAAGGASTILGAIACGVGEAQDGDERPVHDSVKLKAVLRHHRPREVEVVVPSDTHDLLVELEPAPEQAGADDLEPDNPDAAVKWGAAPGKLVEGAPAPRAFALVVAVEHYRELPAAPGARHDAERFKALATRTLGVPGAHVREAVDGRATKADIERHVQWLRANAGKGARIYVYFAGRGAPDVAHGAWYLVPHDGSPRALERTAISVAWLLDQLTQMPASEVLGLFDASFAGTGERAALPEGASPPEHAREPFVAHRAIVLSAGGGREAANSDPDNGGGLFTQALLEAVGEAKADRNADGQMTLKEIAQWVGPHVAQRARRAEHEQTPRLLTGRDLDPAVFMVAQVLPP